jgi:hypothetical protein
MNFKKDYCIKKACEKNENSSVQKSWLYNWDYFFEPFKNLDPHAK